jgi:hypothetical protein
MTTSSIVNSMSSSAALTSGTSTPSATNPPSTSLYAPLPAASVDKIDISCPRSLLSYNEKYYNCFPQLNIEAGNVMAISAYSLQQCIDACSTMNEVVGPNSCIAISLIEGLASDYRNNHGANCWLKNATSPTVSWSDGTVAVLTG